jgi:menaquinol-cytochrome c reductase iron-sulfur subunit
MDEKADEKAKQTGRRGALKVLVVVSGAAACGAICVPGAELLTAPVHSGGGTERWIRTVKLDALADGAPKKVAIVADARDAWMMERQKELGAVWMVRRGQSVECFSAVCPHLGCSIGFEASSGFFCPCHDSSFAADGAAKKGPSPRGMDKLTTRVSEGYVDVDFRRFRQGTSERIEIG